MRRDMSSGLSGLEVMSILQELRPQCRVPIVLL
jgi:hypothetical protein